MHLCLQVFTVTLYDNASHKGIKPTPHSRRGRGSRVGDWGLEARSGGWRLGERLEAKGGGWRLGASDWGWGREALKLHRRLSLPTLKKIKVQII